MGSTVLVEILKEGVVDKVVLEESSEISEGMNYIDIGQKEQSR